MTQLQMTSATIVRIVRDGRIIADMPLTAVYQIGDGELNDAVQRAQTTRLPVQVPSVSYARGMRPRNSVIHSVSL
jgi:hypothetical protein